MGFLFLDIETYSAENNPESSLNPLEPEAKVLVIAYNYYSEFTPPTKDQVKEPTMLTIWDFPSEKEMLQKFYHKLSEISAKDKYLNIVGFNIAKFDLPYLFCRMNQLEIAPEKELYKKIIQKPYQRDMLALSCTISQNTKKHKQLWPANLQETLTFFNMKGKEGTGLECSKDYDKKDYPKIIKYCKSEFKFEELLEAMYLYHNKTNKEKAF